MIHALGDGVQPVGIKCPLLELIKMSYHTRNVTEAMKVILDMCLVWPFEDPLGK